MLKFGPTEAVREEYWAERGLAFFEALLRDLRFGWRSLRKSPGFTVVALVTLALALATQKPQSVALRL